MAAATIKRGTARPKQRGRKAAPKKPSLARRLLSRLPVPLQAIQHYAGYALVAFVIALMAAAAMLAGLPQVIGIAAGETIGRAGFRLERIELTGVNRMERLTIYAIAAEQNGAAMPLVDLDGIRAELLKFGWIEEARVSLRLPNTLLIDVIERKPAAVWQNAGALTLVDHAGVQLEPVELEAMPDLPLVIGPDANKQVAGLGALIATAPQLKPMLAGATWIGRRRWDLRFQSGETLALPEGGSEATAALGKFATMDGRDRLLGRGFTRFDMRVPGRFYVRVPDGQKRIDALDREGESDGATEG